MRTRGKILALAAAAVLGAACAGAPEPEPPPDRFRDVVGGAHDDVILVDGPPPADPVRRIEGRVTAVDPELEIAILSVGSDDGVRPGMTLTVYRGSDYVGRFLVEKVYPDSCAVRFLPGLMKRIPAVGDPVTTAF